MSRASGISSVERTADEFDALLRADPTISTAHVLVASPNDLDARMRAILAALARIDCEIGHALRILFDERCHQRLGYASMNDYVRERLGICPRKARALVALERAGSSVAPALIEAYRAGRLSWLRCLLLLPIVDDRNVAAWVARACEVPVRRLNDELEWVFDACGGVRGARGAMPPPSGHNLTHTEPDSASTRSDADGTRHIGGHMHGADPPETNPPAEFEVRIRGPVSVIAMLHAAISASKRADEAHWRGFERVLQHAETHWRSGATHHDPVFERDGWRCAAPACTSRRNLHDHHVVFRSHGGGNAMENRITLCAWHHVRGIHAGRVRLTGSVTSALCWELGLRRDGPALMHTIGDQYVLAAQPSAAAHAQVDFDCECASRSRTVETGAGKQEVMRDVA